MKAAKAVYALELLVRDKLLTLFVLISAGYYVVTYVTYYARRSWLFWWDQSWYYKMSDNLLNLSLEKENFSDYGIGYPVLSIPFAEIMPNDRFLVPDLLMFVMLVYVVYSLSSRLCGSRRWGVLSVFLFVFLPQSTAAYVKFAVEPWRNHVFAFVISFMAYSIFGRITSVRRVCVGLLAGWMYMTSFLDILFVIPLLVGSLLVPSGFSFRDLLNRLFTTLLPLGFMISLTLVFNELVLGDAFYIPYMVQMSPRELLEMEGLSTATTALPGLEIFTFDPTVLVRRIYSLAIDPMYYYRYLTSKPNYEPFMVLGRDYMYGALYDKTPIIASDTFYLALSPIGMVYLLFRRDRRLQALCLLASILITLGAYTSTIHWYSGWARFFRYHQVLFPLLTIFSVVSIWLCVNTAKRWI